MTEEVEAKVKEFSKKMGISRSSAISVLCCQALEMSSSMDTMKQLLEAHKKAEENKQKIML